MRNEATTADQNFLQSQSIQIVHVFFSNLQECLYPVQRDEVLQNPCLRPRTRKISKSSAKASDLEILLVLGLWQGNSNTSPLWPG